MAKNLVVPGQVRYLFNIIGGVVLLTGVIAAGVCLKSFGLAPTANMVALAVVLLALLALFPLVRSVSHRMDELQQALHEKASAAALALSVALAAVVGVLQANDVIPLFNQLWTFAAIVALWAIGLMLTDAKFK
ncbi:MAG: hypothetical protein V4805_19995 [Pseudomonadota bacterium]